MKRNSRTGFSLVELVLTVVILAVAISGSITILGGMTRQSTDAEKQALAIEYGRMRMEQILNRRFAESIIDLASCNFGALGFDAGENETNYDDVDDLNGWTGEIATDPLAGKGLQTNVTVQYVIPAESGAGSLAVSGPSTCYKRITVQVLDSQTSQVLFTARSMVTPYK